MKDELKQEILAVVFKYVAKENCAVFLFGSLAQNKVYPSSDIDIGIISDKSLENSVVVKIKEELQEAKTLRDIDIADFSSIQDKKFLKIALRAIQIWHQTKRSKAYLSNLKKRITD
ncbi:MAG: nucleotidyltransferase domain-containing protein [Planctomycetota bacterium]